MVSNPHKNINREAAKKVLNQWLNELNEAEVSLLNDNKYLQKESIDYNDLPTVLTAKEVGEILSISKPTAYKIMKMKGFPLLEIGRSKRTLKKEFFNWLSCSDRK